MADFKSAKIEWSIKKDDFLSRKFDDAKLVVGIHTWSLSSVYENPLQGDTVFLTLTREKETNRKSCFCGCWQSFGIICLKGPGGFHVMKPWHWGELHVELKVETSSFSFDEMYLFPDGTYRIEFSVEQDSLEVDFESPDHALILGPSDVGCLEIEGKKLYVSKSYFSAQSPYFKALFFGDFKEKDQEVIVLNDVKFDTFTDFLKHLYVEFRVRIWINDTVIPDVLALADMFLCNTVKRSCESFVVGKRSLTIADLELADKYRLQKLKVRAVARLSIDELKKYSVQTLNNSESFYTRFFIKERIKNEQEPQKPKLFGM